MKVFGTVFMALMLVVALLAGLVGCGNESGNGTTETVTVTVTETPTESEEVFEWNLQAHTSPEPLFDSHDVLAEMIYENTNGRVVVTPIPCDTFAGSYEVMNAVADGILEAASWEPGMSVGDIPADSFASTMPFTYGSDQEITQILYDYGVEELMREEYAKHGVYLLKAIAVGQAGYGLLLREPIESLEDLKGLNIRSFGSYLELVERLGASPVTMALGEVYTALTMGTIDGVITNWQPVVGMSLYEAAPYGVQPSLQSQGWQCIIVNTDVWNALPDDLKTIVQLTANDWAYWIVRYFGPNTIGGRVEELKGLGMEFITLSEADQQLLLSEAAEMWEEQAQADELANQVYNIIMDYKRETGQIE